MGKGDRRTRRGKIYNGSYGKRRPQRGKAAKTADQATPNVAAARGGRSR